MKVRNLGLMIEDKVVFRNINLDLEKGKITLLTGKSGVGKSSLLMTMCGVIPNTIDGEITGSISVDGESVLNLPTEYISGKLAYVSQDADSQLCTFTVEDELAFSLENFNYKKNEMDERINYTLEMLGIEKLRNRNLNSLSGGEKQKVVLASILVFDPEIILADEPTANLDPKSTKQILNQLRLLSVKYGKTILLVEHKIEDVKDIVDTVLCMKNDEVVIIDKNKFYREFRNANLLPKLEERNLQKDEILKVENLYFSYDDATDDLQDLNFEVYREEILGITGYNGAGKSTLLKLIMGLLKPKYGKVLLEGECISEMNPKKVGKLMGMVFQNPEHQFIKMTTEEEMQLSLVLNKENEEVINSKTEEYLELFELEDVKENNPFLLSQGQKRRLSTASMMINGQRILLLDEPTYGQDRENLKKLIELLYRVNLEGTTIIIVTHDEEIIKKSCDRILFLENKKIKYLGKADDFIEFD